jgi:ADP-heptose:LPS heptosyltransferase/GT2 family glycosyltransferase
MSSDVPDPAVFPARRSAIRGAPALQPPVNAAETPRPELRFQPEAEAPGTDLDVLMGYQIFLGRDPENSFVIGEAKANPVRNFIRGLLSSGEFQSAVAQPLMRGQAMPHERTAMAPSTGQIDWIGSRLVLDEATAMRLAQSANWRGFWQTLASIPGFPLAPVPAPAAPTNLQARDADEGFVLITIDQPKPGVKLHPGALLSGSGWAIAPADITEVSVHLDDTLLTHARYGLPRPDVARNFPHYRHVDHCGFAFSAQVPTDVVLTTTSQVMITIKTERGQTGRRGVHIEPPASTIPSAATAAAAWPIRLFVEDVRVDGDAELKIRGWAISRANVTKIAVFLGNQLLGTAERGLSRPDIAATYADYPDAGGSGFSFAASLRGQQAGPAAIRVQVIDSEGQQRQASVPVAIPVTVSAPPTDEALQAGDIRLNCDAATISQDGAILVQGWAIASGGLDGITVSAGGRMLGPSETGRARVDVARSFPTEPEAAHAGFRFSMAPGALAAIGGAHLAAGDIVTLRLTSRSGAERSIDIPLAAAPAAASVAGTASQARLEIDRPLLIGDHAAAPLRGALTISGWAVAPDGLAEIIINCDGNRLDQAYLGMRREDIARAYPDCIDSLRAGYALVLPPGALAEGRRQFTVIARSRTGDETSRSFSIDVEPVDFELPGSVPRRRMPRAERAFNEALLDSQNYHPLFGIVIPIKPGCDLTALHTTLASLTAQYYARFDVLLVPANAACRRIAADAQAAHQELAGRLQIDAGRQAPPPPRQPAAAKNHATTAPSMLMALQPGDELGVDALLELTVIHAIDRDVDFIYADDHRFDAAHNRRIPFYKPDWSPELLLAMDYVGRPWVAKAAVLERAGLQPADLGRIDPYDLVLRLTEAAPRIRHLNKVLAAAVDATSQAAAEAALRAAARRRRLRATTHAGPLPGLWRFQRAITAPGLVSVIIPTAGRGGLIRRAIASLRETTPPGSLEIIVLDDVPPVEKRMKTWLRRNADRVVDVSGPFNWSRYNNAGAAVANGDYLLFLNDDVEARHPGWLDALLEHAQRPEVGVVGARLLYPDGKVQHSGQYLATTHARHAFRFNAGEDDGPFGLARAAREMAAVTGACQMIRRDVFHNLGRFDEAHDVINNDLDFCLRCWRQGLAVIYTPHAELMHHELATRASMEDSFDAERFTGDWRLDMLRGDPFHSRRLMSEADHTAPEPEPVLAVHAGPNGLDARDVRRILAVKLDHIGDYLTALPALRDLKTAFPKAQLTLLAPPATAALARRETCIDRVIDFVFFHPRSAEGQRAVTDGEYAALAAQLAPEHFDLAIDLRVQPETRTVLQHSGAAMLAGFNHNGAFPWLDVELEWEGDQRLQPKHAHVSDRLRMLVAATLVACAPLAARAILPATNPHDVPALARLPSEFLARRLVCIHPGVGNPVRQWSPASYAGLIDLLAAEELNIILIGGGDEQAVAQDVLDRVKSKESVASLVGSLKLAELGDVMQACAIFVGNNSGPKHLAASLGVPTLGIHSSVVDAAEWAPLGLAAMALQRRVICGPCYLEFATDCPRAMACLTGIAPRDVLAACRRLLALRPPAPAIGRRKIQKIKRN